MTKAERRINNFSSGVRKLDDKSLSYIHKLTQVLFMVEHPPVYPGSEKKALNQERKTVFMRRDRNQRWNL
jgi:hypothetical protein